MRILPCCIVACLILVGCAPKVYIEAETAPGFSVTEKARLFLLPDKKATPKEQQLRQSLVTILNNSGYKVVDNHGEADYFVGMNWRIDSKIRNRSLTIHDTQQTYGWIGGQSFSATTETIREKPITIHEDYQQISLALLDNNKNESDQILWIGWARGKYDDFKSSYSQVINALVQLIGKDFGGYRNFSREASSARISGSKVNKLHVENTKEYSDNNGNASSDKLRKECHDGRAEKCAELATTVPWNEGKRLWNKSCDLGNGGACAFLATVYSDPDRFKQKLPDQYPKQSDIQKDLSRARKLFEKACNNDHLMSCDLLATYFIYGTDGLHKDYEKGFNLLIKACNMGHNKSCKLLGEIASQAATRESHE